MKGIRLQTLVILTLLDLTLISASTDSAADKQQPWKLIRLQRLRFAWNNRAAQNKEAVLITCTGSFNQVRFIRGCRVICTVSAKASGYFPYSSALVAVLY
ncbi:hypothetical protein MHYP_G00037840 [Metynnis hypsauchen]